MELNPKLAEAHNALGKIAQYDLNFAESVREFQRAVDLNPNYAGAHHWFGNTFASLGRFDESIAEGRRATELDPLSAVIFSDLARNYGFAHRFQEAETAFKRALAVDPAFAYGHRFYGEMLQARGDLTRASAEYAKAQAENKGQESIALTGQLAAINGRRDEATRALTLLDGLSKQRYVGAYWRALLYLGLGDRDGTLRSLEQSYAEGDGSNISALKVDPMLDSLRGDTRFEALVRKVIRPIEGAQP